MSPALRRCTEPIGCPCIDALVLPKTVSVICRNDVAQLQALAEESAAAHTQLRHSHDLKERRATRRKAAAWRKACQQRELDHERQQKAEELAERQHLEELELANQRKEEVRWSKVLDRLRDRKARMKDEMRASVMESHQAELCAVAAEASEKSKLLTLIQGDVECSPDARVEMLRQAHKLKKRAQKRCLRHETRKSQFWELSDHDRTLFEAAFARFDKTGTKSLEPLELRDALHEFGVRGIDAEESSVLLRFCDSAASANLKTSGCAGPGSVDLFEFAMEVVPMVQKQLMKLRRPTLLHYFDGVDAEGSGKVPFIRCVDAARLFAFVDASLETARRALNKLQHNDSGVLSSPDAVLQDFASVVVAKTMARSSTLSISLPRLSDTTREEELTLDFPQFELLTFHVVEQAWREAAASQRRIEKHRKLDAETAQSFRVELIALNELFDRADWDHSGSLDARESLQLCKELGMLPKSPADKLAITRLVTKHPELDFKKFLHVVTDIRRFQEARLSEQVLKLCGKFKDPENPEMVHVSGVSRVFEELGICPQTRQEQEAVSRIIHDSDAEGVGKFPFAIVNGIVQLAKEQLYRVQLLAEEGIALEYGFDQNELGEYRWAFEQLDVDGSASLDVREVKAAMALMSKRSMSDLQFEAAFRQLDQDGGGALEFTEFLLLMRMLRDEEGVFSVEQTPLTSFDRMSRKGLVQILECFSVSVEALEELETATMVDRVGSIFGIEDAAAPIRDRLSVISYPALLEHSARQNAAQGGLPREILQLWKERERPTVEARERSKSEAWETQRVTELAEQHRRVSWQG